MLTHAARRSSAASCARSLACGSSTASRWRQPTGSGRCANQYQPTRTRVLTHAARLLISRHALACGSSNRRAVGVSQRVLAVALVSIDKNRVHARGSPIISRHALACGSSNRRRAVGVSQRVLAVVLISINRQEPACSRTRLADSSAAMRRRLVHK